MDKAQPETTPEPKKYIRTFSGDMEALKAGGVPELVPIKEPPPVPIPEPAPSQELPPSVPLPIMTHLETYASDFEDKMKETQASAVTVLAAEQDSAPHAIEIEPEKSSRAILTVIAGCGLLIVGSVGAYLAYSRYLTAQEPIATAPQVSAPIFVDEREEISGSGPALLAAIETSLARPLTPNKVRLLYTVNTSSTQNIFSAIPTSAPDILRRNVEVASSMVGIVSTQDSQSAFFILSVSSYSNTFSGMLSWESSMPRDLGTLFPAYTEGLGGQASSTTATTTLSATTTRDVGFSDITVANHDVRVYRDASGRTIVLYGYWNQTTLVIAHNAAAFTEIVQRLATSRAQK